MPCGVRFEHIMATVVLITVRLSTIEFALRFGPLKQSLKHAFIFTLHSIGSDLV